MLAAACGGGDDAAKNAATPTAPTSEAQILPGGSHGTDAHEAPFKEQNGITEEAAIATAMLFTHEFATYNTYAQNPRADWFDRWKEMASEQLVGKMRKDFHGMWSFAWNNDQNVFIDGLNAAETSVQESTAKVRIEATRMLMGPQDTFDDAERSPIAYEVTLDLFERANPVVTDIQQVRPAGEGPKRAGD